MQFSIQGLPGKSNAPNRMSGLVRASARQKFGSDVSRLELLTTRWCRLAQGSISGRMEYQVDIRKKMLYDTIRTIT